MKPPPSLLPIIAHARSGALDHAWRLYREAGLEAIDDDPAVLSVRGRLLKDRALAAAGAERRAFYLQAADAYARAGELGGATYPLINAATLSRLAGQADRSAALAEQVLDRIARGEDAPETDYWRGATRAEALLLLGRMDEARTALDEAVAEAPRAWEDHASTLRQFALILADIGADARWLDAYRPPRSLHFAGHMALGKGADDVARHVRATLDEERIGFGFGALAAGADILIAEALLERGAELHLILPATREAFREASVARTAAEWAERFDRVIARADTVRSLGPTEGPLHPLGVRLAAEVAMGQAAMHAQTLASEAVQLLIMDRAEPAPREDGISGWIRATWAMSGRRQHVVVSPRVRAAAPAIASGEGDATLLAAMLAIEATDDEADLAGRVQRRIDELLPRLARAMAAGPATLFAPRWSAQVLLAAYAGPPEAAAAALALAGALKPFGVRIGGHYGLVRCAADPFAGPPLLLGKAAATPLEVLASVPPDAIHVTEDFAAALHAGADAGRPRTEYVGDLPTGELDSETRLFALKP